jgi:tetratricopeptide (TPR) repeat protein
MLPLLSRLAEVPRLSVLGNPNTMASYIALVIPITWYKLTVVRTALARVLLGLWLALLLVAILLSQSRGGLLALLTAVIFYAAVAAYRRGRLNLPAGQTPEKSQDRLARAWLLAGVVLVISLVGLALAARGLSEGILFRQQVITGALKAWGQRPFLGSGPGTLGEQLVRFQEPLDVVWADAHNLFLTLAAETGLVGAAGLLWLMLAGLGVLYFTFRRMPPAEWNMASLACAAALLGFAAHNLVDSLFKYPVIMLFVSILAGCWLSPYLAWSRWYEKVGSTGWGYPAVALAGVVLAANTVVGIRGIQNIKVYNQAVEAAARGEWVTALDHLRLARQLAPAEPFYQRQLSFVLGYLSGTDAQYLPEAVAQYRATLENVDRLAADHAHLGCLLAQQEQWREAGQAMAWAAELEPGNPLYRLNRGYYLEMEGNSQAAQVVYAEILAGWPDYRQSGYWLQGERQVMLPRIEEEAVGALRAAGRAGWLRLVRLQVQAGRYDEALQIYEQALGENWSDVTTFHREKGRILAAMDRPAEAEAEFEAALQLDPGSSEAHLYLSRIALAQEHLDRAAAHAAAALFLEKNPDTLYQSGRVAEARGNVAAAVEQYDAAFGLVVQPPETNLTRYATEVARQRPLPAPFLPCLIRLYPTEFLVKVTQAEGALLESQGAYGQAEQVYQRLLEVEPSAAAASARLETWCGASGDTCRPPFD